MGFDNGDHQMIADTPKAGGGTSALTLRETALGYEETLG
jgi:hypothetical protein